MFLTMLDLEERLEGFKEEVRGFKITHKQNLDDKAVKKAIHELKTVCGIEDCDRAFIEFKSYEKQTQDLNLESIEARTVWVYPKKKEFKNIRKIFLCACALPLANADVERGFSLMNNIKTDLRNRLKNDLLFSLMILGKYK